MPQNTFLFMCKQTDLFAVRVQTVSAPMFAEGKYVNYLDNDEAGDPVSAAYGPN